MSLIQPGRKRTAKWRTVKRTGTRRSVVEQKTAYRRAGASCPFCEKWITTGIVKHKEKMHGEQMSEARTAALKDKKARLLEQEKKAKADLAASEEIRRGEAKQNPLYGRSTGRTHWGADSGASALKPK